MSVARRPTRAQSRHLFSTLSVAFFALLALVSLCPSTVNAEESHPEYGTVIGIGKLYFRELQHAVSDGHWTQIWELREQILILKSRDSKF